MQINGVDVYDRQADDNKADHKQLRILVQEAISNIEGYRYLNGWDFVFSSAWFAKRAPDGRVMVADGLTVPEEQVIFLKVHKCFAHSAIFHEAAHAVLYSQTGSGDMNHTKKDYWLKVKEKEKRMVKRYCPPGYDVKKEAQPPKEIQFVGYKDISE